MIRRGRVPSTCPIDFAGRYTVVKGDTMYLIAKRIGVPLDLLIKANPHITNPSKIYPGDIVCVPSELLFPFSVILRPVNTTPHISRDTLGVALIRQLDMGQQQSVSILAVNLPPAEVYGDYDIYEGFVDIPDVGGFGFLLHPTPEEPPAWTGTLTIGPFLTSSTVVQVRPANFVEGTSGLVVLEGILEDCIVYF